MRLALFFLVLTSTLPASGDDQLPTLESILTASEQQKYRRASNYQETMKVLRRVLDRYAHTASRMLEAQKLDDVTAAVRAIRRVVREGSLLTEQMADSKALRSRAVRRMEIRLRKMAEELGHLRKASHFELWEDFDAALEDVKAFRSDLLEGLFASAPPPSDPLGSASTASVGSFLPAGTETAAQRRMRSTITGDQFTSVEYELVQDAQALKPRVKVFLKIAEARLDEIERRMAGTEWEKEDPNPLEFYTYAQLVRAYQRSLRSTMINIDEKARYKSATEKDIQKSLELLNSGIQTFIPRIEPVKKLAEDREDEDLHLEWREAWKFSQKALQGSQFGLGAPAKQKDP